MKTRKDYPVPAIGGSSLLVIFAVLCLTVLSLLSLNTVLAEQRLSDAYGEAARDWYAADLRAQEIYARLRAGETVPGVEQAEDRFVYEVRISERQTLQVTVREVSGSWEVVRWQTVAHREEAESSLPVWQGTGR